jgi:hypothetical protein
MASAYLHRTNGTPTNGQKMTFSTWFKIGTGTTQKSLFGSLTTAPYTQVKIMALATHNNVFRFEAASVEGNATDLKLNRSLRDPSAWYHLVIGIDTTQAGSSDRVKIYINGVQETSFATSTYPTQNDTLDYSKSGTVAQVMAYNNTEHWDGSFAHTHFIDGLQYAASDFGETDSTSGIWVAKTSPSVTYGSQGFFLKYASGAITTDSSGNGNTMTQVGTITTTKDTPDDNFCTMNPLCAGVINGAGMPLTNGNTTIYDGDANWRSAFGTLGDNQGKYYFEAKMVGSSTNWWIGFLDARQVLKGEYKFTEYTRGYGVSGGGNKGNSNTEVSWGVTYAQNDIAMCALDLDNGKIYFGKNGTWSESGDPTSGSTGTGAAYSVTTDYIYLPAVGLYDTTAGMSLNFGNGYFGTTAVSSAGTNASGIGTFEYDVPTGYTAVSTLGFME